MEKLCSCILFVSSCWMISIYYWQVDLENVPPKLLLWLGFIQLILSIAIYVKSKIEKKTDERKTWKA